MPRRSLGRTSRLNLIGPAFQNRFWCFLNERNRILLDPFVKVLRDLDLNVNAR